MIIPYQYAYLMATLLFLVFWLILFILRKDLGISPAKLAVQVGHGTGFIYENKDENPFFEDWLNKKMVISEKSF